MKKKYTQQLQKIPPPPGGTFDLRLKKIYVIFADYYGRNEKAPQAKIFVIGTIFTPKIAQKCKKNGQQKIHPPVGGGQKMYLIWESPRPGGDYRKSPHWGDLPPP